MGARISLLEATERGIDTSVPLGKLTKFGYSTNFDEKYQKGKLLCHSQRGDIYVATARATGDKAAVKILDKNKMLSPITVEDVRREVQIMKALSGHENVVQFHDAFEDDESVYFVMELCEGGNLLDRIFSRVDKRFTEEDAAKLLRQILNVVARCHLHGIVHRDVQPENFLFKEHAEGSPLKAAGFGLSDFIIPGKTFEDVAGHPYYIAPEVWTGESGAQSDAWSIGVIAYFLLSGRLPFWDKTQDKISKKVLKEEPKFWPPVSASAKDFVKKLLVKDPRARMTAAQALSHVWVREGGDASDIPLDVSVLSNMRKFVKYSRLKQVALTALASTLDNDEIANLRDQFNAMDIGKNGTISPEEMYQALAKDKPWMLKEFKALEILQAMDTTGDGLVDFNEFVAATLHVHQLEEHNTEKWYQRTEAAFNKFDLDKDGYITADELRAYTGMKGSIANLLDEADTDMDGRISLQEFRKLLQVGMGIEQD